MSVSTFFGAAGARDVPLATKGEVIFSFVMLAIVGGMTILAMTYPAETRLAPLVIGLPATGLCLLNAVTIMSTKRGRDDGRRVVSKGAEISAIMWFLGFVTAIVLLGFYVGAPLMIFFYYWRAQRVGLLVAIGAALVIWLLVYGVFTIALEQLLFQGVLFDKFA